MKLFKRVLLAPVTMGLIAPISSPANEINFTDLSKYSSSTEVKNIKDFNPPKQIAVDKSNLKSFESISDNFEAGSFSSTTTLSSSASFVIGAIDNDEVYNATETGAVTFHYSYDIDLNTSFNGDDNLFVGIEAGNVSTELLLDSTNIATDTLTVGSLFYSFPLGGWDIAVGPKLDQDDLVPTTTTKYSDSFYFGGTISNNVWTLPGLTGTGITFSKVFENGFNVGANLMALEASSDGIFTNEGADTKTLMVGYDGENFGGGLIHSKYDDIWDFGDQTAQYYLTQYGVSKLALNTTSVGAYWIVNDKLTTNIGVEFIDADIGKAADTFSQMALSMDYDFDDNNTFSAAYKSLSFLNTNGTADKVGDGFEFYYTHKMNDSMTSKIGLYYASPSTNVGNGTVIKDGGTGDDFVLYDQIVYAFETTFKF